MESDGFPAGIPAGILSSPSSWHAVRMARWRCPPTKISLASRGRRDPLLGRWITIPRVRSPVTWLVTRLPGIWRATRVTWSTRICCELSRQEESRWLQSMNLAPNRLFNVQPWTNHQKFGEVGALVLGYWFWLKIISLNQPVWTIVEHS